MRFSFLGVMLLAPAVLPQVAFAAPTVTTVIYNFSGYPDGAEPLDGLITDTAGNLYGTAAAGGKSEYSCASRCGTVFELVAPAAGKTAWTQKVLYAFTGGTDGISPVGLLAFDKAGNLYGTTTAGGNPACFSEGQQGCGTVFELSPPAAGKTAWTKTILYSFAGGTGGGVLNGSLVFDSAGALYGTAQQGGVNCDGETSAGCGVVFKLSPPSGTGKVWTEQTLYAFNGGSSDGYSPAAGVIIDASGALYGMAGPDQFSESTAIAYVYKLTPPAAGQTAWTESILQAFVPSGNFSSGGVGRLLADSTGALYGAVGDGNGKIFKLKAPAGGTTPWTETDLYKFTGSPDGAGPVGGLAGDSAGHLFGATTSGGGMSCGGNGCGTIFRLTPPAAGKTAYTETVLHAFTGLDGEFPNGDMVVTSAGTLYGTAEQGGTGYAGTVLKVIPGAQKRQLRPNIVALSR